MLLIGSTHLKQLSIKFPVFIMPCTKLWTRIMFCLSTGILSLLSGGMIFSSLGLKVFKTAFIFLN